jgi:CheY-like chemotaxis protein
MIRDGNATAACSLARCARGNPPWRGAKILVVEDNHLQAEVVSDFLRDCGLEPVGPAGRLQEACELAQGRPLDGALLDVKLGENLCFPVCTILAARKIPFILLTGYCQSSRIPPALCAAPLVCKPFREDELAAALALILNCRVGNRASANVAAGDSLINR